MKIEPILFAKQLLDYLRGNLSGQAAEQDVLETLAEHRLLGQVAEELQDKTFISHEVKRMQRFDTEKALRRVEQQAGLRREHRLNRWLAAASVAVVLAVGATVWYHQNNRVIPPEISEAVLAAMQQSQQAGRQEAVVEPLATATAPLSPPKGGTTDPALVTNVPPSGGEEGAVGAASVVDKMLAAKRITTRSDKEYWLTLSDGTLVHLNYNTRVIYPERFEGESRDVILEGEAYFMVAKDRRHPFIVHTGQGDVKVYGTEFNVSTHTEQTEVVLVEGSVGVTPVGGTELKMHPGQKWSMANGQWSMENVDVEPYVAWNTGEFVFSDQPIETIMEVLGRWYGRTVVYASDEIRAERFSGSFSRYNEESTTLQAIEAVTGLRITMKANQYLIYNP